MPIEFVVDTMIHDAIMAEDYERAKAIALGEIVKILRDIWGEIEAIKDDGISCNKRNTKEE